MKFIEKLDKVYDRAELRTNKAYYAICWPVKIDNDMLYFIYISLPMSSKTTTKTFADIKKVEMVTTHCNMADIVSLKLR